MNGDYTEHALWALINRLAWFYWGPIAVLAALNAWNLYRMAPAVTLYGRSARVVALGGFILISLSPFNTAFGPLGVPFVLASFWMMTHQMYRQCLAQGKIKRPMETPAAKIAAMIVEPR